MRDLKDTLENHPLYLVLTLTLAILAALFLFIDVHDHFQWNLI